jgi:hypothetical protein
MFNISLTPELLNLIRRSAEDWVSQEQYGDFIRHRRFRRSLFCRSGIPISQDWQPPSLEGLYLACPAEEKDGEFYYAFGVRIPADHGPITSIVRRLVAAWPKALPASEFDPKLILPLLRRGAVDVRTIPGKAGLPSDRPEVWKLARYEAARGNDVLTTLLHTNIVVDGDLALRFVELADGSRDLATLVAELPASREEVARQVAYLSRAGLLA